MRDDFSNRPLARKGARVCLAFALAASMCLPLAGAVPAVADESSVPVVAPDDPAAPGNPVETVAPEQGNEPAPIPDGAPSAESYERANRDAAAPTDSSERREPFGETAAAPAAGAALASAAEARDVAPERYVVTRGDDALEEGTLRWAITQANKADRTDWDLGGPEILIDGVDEVLLEQELPSIQNTMSIKSRPGTYVTIRQNPAKPISGSWRHFRITGEKIQEPYGFKSVTFERLKLEGPGSKAVKGQENGGIYTGPQFKSALNIYDCVLADNANYTDWDEESSDDPLSRGGAINMQSDDENAQLSIQRSTIKNNTASWYGGGVYTLAPGTPGAMAEAVTFQGNVTERGTGGGLLATNNLAEDAQNEVRVVDCVFDGNEAGGDAAGISASVLEMENCTVSNNSAGSVVGDFAAGGGVAAGTLRMTGCEVVGNVSKGMAGGVYCYGSVDMSGSIVSRNEAGSWGGGMVVVEGGAIDSSAFEGNSAAGVGGALAVGSETADENDMGISSALEVTDSTISRNTSKDCGGGIFMYNLCDLELTDVTLADNAAALAGGGVYGEPPLPSDEVDPTVSTLAVVRGEITGNTASGASEDDGAGNGGGLCLQAGPVSVDGCVVSGNKSAGEGGGVFARSATVRNAQLTENKAGGSGGGICALSLKIESTPVSGNQAQDDGGGVDAAALDANGVTFDGNAARTGGGAKATDASLVNCTLSGNAAAYEGGGLSAQEAKLVNCTVSGNSARENEGNGSLGGGVEAAVLAMSGCLVAGNYDSALLPSELRVNGVVDNGAGAVSDAYGKKNLVGAPAGGLQEIMVTEAVDGRPVGALADNGGATPTILLAPRSPARDAVEAGDYAVPDVDQRGVARPFGAAVDIGALEATDQDFTYQAIEPFGTYRGGDEPLSATIDAPALTLVSVAVAGNVLKLDEHYAVSENGTKIMLLPAYLKTLKNGVHEVAVTFEAGLAKLPLTVDVEVPKPIDPDDPKPVDPDDPKPKPVDPTKPSEDVKKKPVPLVRTGDEIGLIGGAFVLAALTALIAFGIARRRVG